MIHTVGYIFLSTAKEEAQMSMNANPVYDTIPTPSGIMKLLYTLKLKAFVGTGTCTFQWCTLVLRPFISLSAFQYAALKS